jgi:hypothetical protein
VTVVLLSRRCVGCVYVYALCDLQIAAARLPMPARRCPRKPTGTAWTQAACAEYGSLSPSFQSARWGYRIAMEARGDTPRVWMEAPDLAELVQRPGPFLTVQLATEASIENAAQRNQLRWRARREELASSETPEDVLGAVDPLVADAHTAWRDPLRGGEW